MSDLADACMTCFPGDFPATLPESVTEENGSLRAAYRCTQGHRWTCWWDRQSAGWPERRAA